MVEAEGVSSHSSQSNSTYGIVKVDKSDVILELSNDIAVRRYRASDAPSIAHHGNNKKIWNNLRNRMPQPYTEEGALWWINHSNDPANWVRSGFWTLQTGSPGPPHPTNFTITHNDTAIGSVGIETNETNEVYARTAEIGYWLGEEYWGQGIMGMIVPAFVEWVFATFEILVRIEAGVYDRNKGSRRVLEKAGFQFEGVRKARYLKNGVLGDEIMLGIVRKGIENKG